MRVYYNGNNNNVLRRLWAGLKVVYQKLRYWILGEMPAEDCSERTAVNVAADGRTAGSVVPKDEFGLGFIKHKPKAEGMSRQLILDLICEEFERGMQKLTTRQSLMFPFNYCIFLNPTDFAYFKQTFFKDAEDAAKELRQRVDNMVRRDARFRDFTPLSSFWQFQFLPFNDGQILQGEGAFDTAMKSLAPGQARVISTPLIEDLTVERDIDDGSAVVTVKRAATTQIQKIVINPEAMRGIDVVSNYCFRISLT
ncbi:MAG: hypothetical protein J5486_10875 [Bacteroidaceae bacterium]|nr:hypothetical protein [Bacteroidaceae bacterium]